MDYKTGKMKTTFQRMRENAFYNRYSYGLARRRKAYPKLHVLTGLSFSA